MFLKKGMLIYHEQESQKPLPVISVYYGEQSECITHLQRTQGANFNTHHRPYEHVRILLTSEIKNKAWFWPNLTCQKNHQNTSYGI